MAIQTSLEHPSQKTAGSGAPLAPPPTVEGLWESGHAEMAFYCLQWHHPNPKAPTLVLLPGLASDHRLWHRVIHRFLDTFHIVALEYPGHGQCPPHSKPYRMAHLVQGFQQWLGEEHLLGAPSPEIHLMALSMGCHIALMGAYGHPEKIRSIVLQGPSGGLSPWWHPLGWCKFVLLLTYVVASLIMCLCVGKTRVCHWINQWGPQCHGYQPLLDTMQSQIDPWAVMDLSIANGVAPYLGKLEALTCPMVIIRGQEEGFPKRYAQYILDHWGGNHRAMVEVTQARHVVILDQPKVYLNACHKFYAQHGFMPIPTNGHKPTS